MKTTVTETSRFLIQRFVNHGPQNSEGYWHDYAHENDLRADPELLAKFRESQKTKNGGFIEFDIANDVLLAVQKANPFEDFRLVKEAMKIERTVYITAHAIQEMSVEDLKNLADNPKHHDGVRIFNALKPVIAKVGLDPDYRGAYKPSVVKFAIEHLDTPPDVWFTIYDETAEDYVVEREWTNLKQGVTIRIQNHFGTVSFLRINYRPEGNVSLVSSYKTFRAAAEQNNEMAGFVKFKQPEDRGLWYSEVAAVSDIPDNILVL